MYPQEAKFLTVAERNYKYEKEEEQNEPCDTGLKYQRYQYELIFNTHINRYKMCVYMYTCTYVYT